MSFDKNNFLIMFSDLTFEFPTMDYYCVTLVSGRKSWGMILNVLIVFSVFNAMDLQEFSRMIPQINCLTNKMSVEIINFKYQILKPFWTSFQKSHLIWRYRFHGRRRGANTFPTRKCTPEPNFLFSQTSEPSFHKF